ncbi:MAG: hypothetical protein HOP03_16015 [Lysobacter sp.]|nr:hypothetical protein [Lysobacter sp.]
MSTPSRNGPAARPVALVIAAQMRLSMPKTAQPHHQAPVNVKHALKNAANSSPAAKAAFKRAAPSVKAATPHIKALAQPGKGLLSSLRHGVSALRPLRQVTREMRKESTDPKATVASAFKAAANASPAAAAAFQHAAPAAAKAQQHVEALSRLQQGPKSGLLSTLGHGVQAMRSLRQVTKAMPRTPGFAPIESAHGVSHALQSPENPHASQGQAIDHRELLAQLRQHIASAQTTPAQGGGTAPAASDRQAPVQFAAMLIVRGKSAALSAFKDRG